MSDQAFVKAFSRRRPANEQSTQAGGIVLGDAASIVQEPAATHAALETRRRQTLLQQDSNPASDAGTSGGLQLDQSVASTARVWVDHHADRVSRADYAEDGIPRPHLEALAGDQTPSFETRNPEEARQDGRPEIEALDHPANQRHTASSDQQGSFAQPIQDAYASTSMDAASFVNDEIGKVGPAEVLRGMRVADPGSLASGSGLEKEVSVQQPQTHQQPSESFDRFDAMQTGTETPELIIENPFAAAARRESEPEPAATAGDHVRMSDSHFQQQETYQPAGNDEFCSHPVSSESASPGPQTGLKPFQAVWEVDVLDVSTTVADLFFEGRLFQQIAERMSDAIESGLNSVIVTSAQPGEGRSSVAIGLAMAAAAAGKSVALVDANLEQPKLADELRLDLQYGWVDTIRAGLPIKEVAVHAVEDGVTLIPLMPPKGKNAATGYEVVQLINVLKDKFELIILDGPTSQSGQIHQCASAVDSAIIVRDMTRTDTLAINEFSYRLRESGIQGVGVVENFT